MKILLVSCRLPSDPKTDSNLYYLHIPAIWNAEQRCIRHSAQPLITEPMLMLMGGYCYQANVNAANFPVEQVWPQVYRQRPDTRLIIRGKELHHIASYASPPAGVEFTGFVMDLDVLYQRSRAACCLILSGGNSHVKTIAAAAYDNPIVSTRIGAEGIEMADGKEFWLRDRPATFAEGFAQLLKMNSWLKAWVLLLALPPSRLTTATTSSNRFSNTSYP